TGTLTENRMRVTLIHTATGAHEPDRPGEETLGRVAAAILACTNARIDADQLMGDPTEIAMLDVAARLGENLDFDRRQRQRRRQFHFDPIRKRMSTVDERDDGRLWVSTKGAPEAVLPLCATELDAEGPHSLTPSRRDALAELVDN